MNKLYQQLTVVFFLVGINSGFAQVTNLSPEDFKAVNIGYNTLGDYTKSVILLHEVYDGVKIGKNFAIGEVCAIRGSQVSNNRTNLAFVNTSSGYTHIEGGLTSFNSDGVWKLKLVMYQGKKYLALDVPYRPDYHSSGFRFKGWTKSTGENMKWIAYENRGIPVNQDVLLIVGDYSPNVTEYHDYACSVFYGHVGIGTQSPNSYMLAVNGTIRAKEIKVEANWADFVFKGDYSLRNLTEVEEFIIENGHLPDIPTEKEVKAEGISLGEMNSKLLQKIEELTLYAIQLKKDNQTLVEKQNQQEEVLVLQKEEIKTQKVKLVALEDLDLRLQAIEKFMNQK
ncbi:hypothetical protein [Labilibaculum euxinus]